MPSFVAAATWTCHPAADPTLNREVKRWLDMQLANLRDEPAQRARQIVRMLLPERTLFGGSGCAASWHASPHRFNRPLRPR
jgi:hypothetical protein